MSEQEIIIINPDVLKSIIYLLGAFIVILLGFVWKIVAFGFNRFEANLTKTVKNCHKGLDDYAKDTRKKVDNIDRWTADHIEKHHSR